MSKVNITLAIGGEKLEAMGVYLKKQNSTLQKRLDEMVDQLYKQVVPGEVREFLDAKSGAKPKRPVASPPKPQTASTAKGVAQQVQKEVSGQT